MFSALLHLFSVAQCMTTPVQWVTITHVQCFTTCVKHCSAHDYTCSVGDSTPVKYVTLLHLLSKWLLHLFSAWHLLSPWLHLLSAWLLHLFEQCVTTSVKCMAITPVQYVTKSVKCRTVTPVQCVTTSVKHWILLNQLLMLSAWLLHLFSAWLHLLSTWLYIHVKCSAASANTPVISVKTVTPPLWMANANVSCCPCYCRCTRKWRHTCGHPLSTDSRNCWRRLNCRTAFSICRCCGRTCCSLTTRDARSSWRSCWSWWQGANRRSINQWISILFYVCSHQGDIRQKQKTKTYYLY